MDMDFQPTLDVSDGITSGEDEGGEEEVDGPGAWGRLFPLGNGFVAQGEQYP